MASTEPRTGGSRLVKWMKRTGKTQEWLAAELDVSQGTISALIRDAAEPRASIAVRIEKLTGVPVSSWPRIKNGKAA